MSRRPALDGLRGLAVLAVMAFHTSPAAHGGFLGVDIFFVISGYLITSLLLREWSRTGGVDLRSFYVRRTLRLAPALLFMLLLTVPLILAVSAMRNQMGMPVIVAVLSVLFYVANWANVVVPTGTGPLTHTWSLAIEEQFYLIWPLILIWVLTRRRRPPAAALAVAIAVVVAARWITWDQTHADWLYYATTSHCDGLLVGALLAVLLHPPGRRSLTIAAASRSAAAAWVGLAGIVGLMTTLRITSSATYEYGLPLIAVCTALVVWHLATADSGLLVRVLSCRPLVGIGVVSYGLYLYHFPVFKLVQDRGLSHPVQHGLEIGITVVVTAFSWFVVEKPALRLKDRLTRPRETADLALADPTG